MLCIALHNVHVASVYIVFDTGTVILRVAVFPLLIYVQKNMVLMNNHMPVVQKMQEKVSKARRHGDMLEG